MGWCLGASEASVEIPCVPFAMWSFHRCETRDIPCPSSLLQSDFFQQTDPLVKVDGGPGSLTRIRCYVGLTGKLKVVPVCSPVPACLCEDGKRSCYEIVGMMVRWKLPSSD